MRSIHSRKEIIVLGFDPADNLLSMTERVKFVVEEVKNANEAAANLIRLRLNSKKEKLEKEIKEEENLYQKKTSIWSIKNVTRKRQTLKRQASSLIKCNRLKRRKLSNQGPKL